MERLNEREFRINTVNNGNHQNGNPTKLRVSKRKLSRLEKPRKIIKSDSNISYERRKTATQAHESFIHVEDAENVFSPVDHDDNGASYDAIELPEGPQVFGLVPVPNPVPPSSDVKQCHCSCHEDLEKRFALLEKSFALLQNKHDVLQDSYDKLSQLVEAQNHLLTCYSGRPTSLHARDDDVLSPVKHCSKRSNSESPSSPRVSSSLRETSRNQRTFPETPDLLRETSTGSRQEPQYTLPKRATARDILLLWEDGSGDVPAVKNWPPAQKNKVQSKLGRWKRIVDIFKMECNGDMDSFQEKYSNASGELLPVSTILALNENQLSSQFLSKGYTNIKQDSIELDSTSKSKNEPASGHNSDSGAPCESNAIPDDRKTNRYVLPRRATARDVVHLWDYGCDDFPPLATWRKAQKIGQETKIFRWKKIVELFKNECNSDWDLFCERYSNENGELLPLATILSRHEALYAKYVVPSEKSSVTGNEKPMTQITELGKNEGSSGEDRKFSEDGPVSTAEEKPVSVNVPLPRRVTAYEAVRYWTEGSDTFPPVKDWTRTQKMGQETKIGKWKKIYEIFRYQCRRDWEEFSRRYTNQRGELLPIATILSKYEAENPAGKLSYRQQYGENEIDGLDSPARAAHVTGDDPGTNVADDGDVLPQVTDVDIVVTEGGKYILPEHVTAVQALSLWEHGNEQAPPMKIWAEEQAQQPALFGDVGRVAEIFQQESGGNFRKFLDRFSDVNGELLPISGIIYSSDCEEYSPYFTEYKKSAKKHRGRTDQYELPKRVGAKEIVWLWDRGCRDFPPVKLWSSAQKLRYTTKLSRWRKIADIFHEKCDSNWRIYEENYSNPNGELLALSTVIAMQDETKNESYVSMIKRSPDRRDVNWSIQPETRESNVEDNEGLNEENGATDDGSKVERDGNNVEQNEKNKEVVEIELHDDNVGKIERGRETPCEVNDDDEEFDLPKKATSLDIIEYWENGSANMPPVSKWTPRQRLRQRGKIARWSKLYDIYKKHCNGNLAEFVDQYSNENGQMHPVTTIISMYESRVNADENNDTESLANGPLVRKYTLPRKVDAKDIVRFWERGCNEFPPVAAWTKADKIGQETKIFRWKKIVEIFKNYCDSDWEYFEDLFTNDYGELLPISAIIAKYETSFSKR